MAGRKEFREETRNGVANLDINTAFDEAKPKHVAKIMDNHHTHGWIIVALLREMSGLSGKAIFGCVESSFAFNPCLRQGSVESPLVAEDDSPDLGQCGKGMVEEKKRSSGGW